MKILLINHYAGTPEMGMEYRPYYLSCEWLKMGHQVKIIAASQSHVRKIQPDFQGETLQQNIDSIDYLWVKTPEYQGNGVSRVLNMRAFVGWLKKNAHHIANDFKPDVVIASSTYPLDNYPAHKIARLAGAKYVYEVHDLWPLSPMELGGMKWWHPFILWMQRAENYAYKYADKVVSMLPKTQEHMSAHGLDLSKWAYVPNGINLEEWNAQVSLNASTLNQISELKTKFKCLVGYTGSFGVANALGSFIEAAEKIPQNEVALVLVGQGPEMQQLKQKALGLENVYFLDAVPKNEIPALLSHFHILYIGLQRQPLFRFGISPNKIFDYMMAGKPVIQAIEAGNDIVRESGCGISVEPENPSAIAQAIIELTQKTEDELVEMGKNGQKFVMANHDYKVLADRFLSLIKH